MHDLVRYHVFFGIDLASRRVEIGGITNQATGAWMVQVARNLLDVTDGFLVSKTHLIVDRDPLYTRDVRTLLGGAGTEPVRLPARSPNLNAYAERFVLSIKGECVDKLIVLGEAHLRLAVREYVTHYNEERPHQGLGGDFVLPPANENRSAPISARERLGSLLRFYHRHAAWPPRSCFRTPSRRTLRYGGEFRCRRVSRKQEERPPPRGTTAVAMQG